MMQGVCHREHPGQSSVIYLSMLDVSSSDMSCIYSTMKFVCRIEASLHLTRLSSLENHLSGLYWWLGGFHTDELFGVHWPHNVWLWSVGAVSGGVCSQQSLACYMEEPQREISGVTFCPACFSSSKNLQYNTVKIVSTSWTRLQMKSIKYGKKILHCLVSPSLLLLIWK